MKSSDGSIHMAQAEVFKSVGHPIRLEIVKFLIGGERSVSEIVSAVQAEQSNVSRHLALLKQAGVLVCRRSGLKVFYRLASPMFAEGFKVILRQIADAVRGAGVVRMGMATGEAEGTQPFTEGF